MPTNCSRYAILVLVNALGIGLFMQITSTYFWIEPELANEPGANGGAAVGWIVWAAPMGVLFSVMNICWLAGALKTGSPTSRTAAATLTIALLASWIAAYIVDNAHHGI